MGPRGAGLPWAPLQAESSESHPTRGPRPESAEPLGRGGEQEPSDRSPLPLNHSGQVPCAPAKRLVWRAEEQAAGTGGRETMRPRRGGQQSQAFHPHVVQREAQDSHVSPTQEGARRPRCRDRRPPSSAPPEPMRRRRARFCPVSCPLTLSGGVLVGQRGDRLLSSRVPTRGPRAAGMLTRGQRP